MMVLGCLLACIIGFCFVILFGLGWTLTLLGLIATITIVIEVQKKL